MAIIISWIKISSKKVSKNGISKIELAYRVRLSKFLTGRITGSVIKHKNLSNTPLRNGGIQDIIALKNISVCNIPSTW